MVDAVPPTSDFKLRTIVACRSGLSLPSLLSLLFLLLLLSACGADDGVVPNDAPSEFDDAIELAESFETGNADNENLRDDMWGLTAAYCTNINAPSIAPQSQQVIAILAFVESNVCPTRSNSYWQDAFQDLESAVE